MSQRGVDDREGAVLRAVIQHYLDTGEPVGSRTVCRTTKLNLSAASIRNIMADLGERGLLSQPHTSAGRVPTDKAFRLYVDHMLLQQPVDRCEAQAIFRALERNRGELPELLGEASRQLSVLSHQVGLVLGPELRRIVVDHLEFVRVDTLRVMVILVGRSGVVHNRVLEVAEPIEQPELERIGRYLSESFGGLTLPQMREQLRQRMSEERAAYDRLRARSLALARQAVEAELDAAEVFVEGASNLLVSPDLSDRDEIRALFRTLEEKRTLIDLLTRLLDGRGVRVVIGEENPLSHLACCSIVASSYGSGGRVMGTVGIVGPRRMPYARVIPLVAHLARVLTGLLSSPRN